MTPLYYAVFLTLISLSSIHSQDDILGCGGFVKSNDDVNIDLTQVKVQLLTRQGSVKYTTEPAPNGYYMIPVYEKGDYHIKISPQNGWNFEPKESVKLDLEACERNEDFNFIFTGFHLSGKVLSEGSDIGPSGVQITLTSSDGERQSTITAAEGRYEFVNVGAGKHIITASHNTYLFSKSEVQVDVTDGSPVAVESPVVHGYSLTGSISNEGQPVKGVHLVISSPANKQKSDIRGCVSGAPDGYSQKSAAHCYVTSDERGQFSFKSVPVGTYNLTPYHRGEKTEFKVIPNQLDIEMHHADNKLEREFTVSGFSVSGLIKYSPQGKGIASAQISVNGMEVAHTDPQGRYTVEGMKAGDYVFSVTAQSVQFDDVKVKISAGDPQLPVITADRYSVCGKVVLDNGIYDKVSIIVTDKKSSHTKREPVNKDGVFCTDIKSGDYRLQAEVPGSQTKLTPTFHDVTVTDGPISSDKIKFSQFKAVVSGKVSCLAECGDLEIRLKSKSDSTLVKSHKVSVTGRAGAFVLQGVIPGDYILSIDKTEWCWSDNTVDVTVDDRDVADISLQHTGYLLRVQSSHPLTLLYKKSSAEQLKAGADEVKGQFSVRPEENKLCLPSLGEYQLTPQTCHKFDKQTYIYNVRDSAGDTVDIKAVKHSIKYRLISEQAVSDVKLTVRSGDAEVGEIKLPSTTTRPVKEGGSHISELDYEIDVSHTQLTSQPSSNTVLFKHNSISTAVNPGECPGAVVEIIALKGQFIEGSVTPPIEHLIISLRDGEKELKTTPTDKQGKYRFGPIPTGVKYEVWTEKAGYVLEKDDKNPNNFKAFKLAEVAVRVIDGEGVSLPGVILSLSGGRYKSNNRTDDNGIFSFIGLSPGKHYLKAIMKEYEFTPSASVEVNVREGVREDVIVTGSRVAYSCMGRVVSLSGDASTGALPCSVTVRAEGDATGACSNTEESAQAEGGSGYFRVRGLKPGCSYNIDLSVGQTDSVPTAYRVSPQSIQISMDREDMDVGSFILMESSTQSDLTVFIDTQTEYLSTLKVILTKEGSSVPIQSISPGNSKVVFITGLPKDNQGYRLFLETSLSKKLYDYSSSDEVLFSADQPSRAINLKFHTQLRTDMEYEVKESSILALILVILTTLAVFNKHKIMSLVSQQLQ